MGNSYRLLVAANIRAARARADLTQTDVAARMRVLGYDWSYGVVGHVESGRKNLLAGDILAMAVVLETTVASLMAAPVDGAPVGLGNGLELAAVAVRNSAYGMPDGSTGWRGLTHLVVVTPDSPIAQRAAQRAP